MKEVTFLAKHCFGFFSFSFFLQKKKKELGQVTAEMTYIYIYLNGKEIPYIYVCVYYIYILYIYIYYIYMLYI